MLPAEGGQICRARQSSICTCSRCVSLAYAWAGSPRRLPLNSTPSGSRDEKDSRGEQLPVQGKHTGQDITVTALNGAPTCLVVLHRGHKECVEAAGEGEEGNQIRHKERDAATNQAQVLRAPSQRHLGCPHLNTVVRSCWMTSGGSCRLLSTSSPVGCGSPGCWSADGGGGAGGAGPCSPSLARAIWRGRALQRNERLLAGRSAAARQGGRVATQAASCIAAGGKASSDRQCAIGPAPSPAR